MKKIASITLGLFLISICLFGQDFEISPTVLLYTANPGEIQTKEVYITNHDSKPTTIVFKVMDYYINDDGNKQFFPPGSIKKSCSGWLNINPAYILINPNSTGKVDVSMEVPKNDYSTKWAVINVTPVKEKTAFDADDKLSASISIFAQISIDVRQSPLSNKNYKAHINGFTEITALKDTARHFQVNIDNVGEKISRCKIYLIASDPESGEEVQFEPVITEVFPQSSRKIDLTLPNVLPKGKYHLAALLDYGKYAKSLEGADIMIEVE